MTTCFPDGYVMKRHKQYTKDGKIKEMKTCWCSLFLKWVHSLECSSVRLTDCYCEIRIAIILNEQTGRIGTRSSTLLALVYLIESSFLTTVSTVVPSVKKPHDHRYRSSRVGYYHFCTRAGQQLG